MIVRRALLAGLAAVVVAAIIAGVTMFLYRGGLRDAEAGMGPCAEGSTFHCIPHLRAGDMLAALKKRGFDCDGPARSDGCALYVGENVYTVRVASADGGISRLTATVVTRADAEPSAGAVALLRWVAGVPFAQDREGAGEVDAWLVKHVAERRNVSAAIANYEYHLDDDSGIGDRRSLRLAIGEKIAW
ncbi:hypothetical protein [Krasilnikovia sp. M28-CT-15]|uniref:hypothetical protein n=1 Tax=Krasilnikovia sp. M28-CT-15 TaxID=3373540 RepID=UPI003875BAC6